MNPGEYRTMFEAEERHWWYRGLHELVLSVVRRAAAGAPGPLRILDAGCGTGRLMQLLGAFGAVEGCDISPAAVALCRERGLGAVRVADLNSAAFPPAAYDVITALDVLYHRQVRDENAVLRSLSRALKPGGLLIRNDPAFELLRGEHDAAVHTRERYRRGVVRARLAGAGLIPEFVTYRVAPLAPFIALHRLVRRRRTRPEAAASDVRVPLRAANRMLLLVLRLENRLLGRRALPFGSSVFALARRPAPQA